MPDTEFTIKHPVTGKDIEVIVEFDVSAAEPDVGISSWGVENLCIINVNTGEDVQQLNKDMKDKDWDALTEQIYTQYDPYDDGEDYDPNEWRDYQE